MGYGACHKPAALIPAIINMVRNEAEAEARSDCYRDYHTCSACDDVEDVEIFSTSRVGKVRRENRHGSISK